ncbi:hypothetical protein K469DRAFT_686155 [Zopfia rhizophila CBS 207.26]|uniref:Uncharacterized protein n=1 Tax=Zopfia rhizophila CBS 207.26 TaxID=1314779 RepID=A0A6A6E8T1_9PEZI|nr:hypothetical protein K469DRAFT_686155 [Zopfia rhizophila CBS 207.26]
MNLIGFLVAATTLFAVTAALPDDVPTTLQTEPTSGVAVTSPAQFSGDFSPRDCTRYEDLFWITSREVVSMTNANLIVAASFPWMYTAAIEPGDTDILPKACKVCLDTSKERLKECGRENNYQLKCNELCRERCDAPNGCETSPTGILP